MNPLILMPVARTRKPSLPTKEEFDAFDRLHNHLPHRWKLNAAVIAATMLVATPSAWGQERRPLPGIRVPPRYLSEIEAASIIRAEAKKFGISFGKTKKRISFPLTRDFGEPKDQKEKKVTITLDGEDAKRGISFEFLSQVDEMALSSSASSIAKALKGELKKAGQGTKVGVFQVDPSYDTAAQKAKLRKQVRTFLGWLKSQGII